MPRRQLTPQEIVQQLLAIFNAAMEQPRPNRSLDLWPFLTMNQRMQMRQRGFTPNSLDAWFGSHRKIKSKRYV